MADKRNAPPGLGEILSFLRWLAGLTQDALALLSRTDRGQLSRYEKGETPQPGTLQRILAALGVRPRFLDFLRWCLRVIRQALATEQAAELPTREAGWQQETRAAVWDFVDRAVALARAELALLRSARKPCRPSPPAEQDYQRVELLWQRLKGCSEAKQRLLVEGARSYQDWLLAVRLCRESEKAAADKPPEALKLAELAVFVARHVPETDGSTGWRLRLEGWCTAFLANSQKAANDVPLAAATFANALRLWDRGKDEAGLLSEAYLLDMEASLRRAQGLFSKALALHDKARKMARPEEVGIILLNKGFTLQEQGDPEAALQTFAEAAQVIDGESHPRLRCVLRYNQAESLRLLGRAEEAAPIAEEVQRLAEGLGNGVDLVKTAWLLANVDAGLGRRQQALEALEKVRRDFDDRKLPYDYALASLDAAVLYRDEGRWPEIKLLAREILEIFQAQGVGRETVAAVILFQEAAEQERITASFLLRLQEFLSKARTNPKLRFKEKE